MQYKILTVLAVLVFSFAFSTTASIEKVTSLKSSNPEISSEINSETTTFKAEVKSLYDEFAGNNSTMPGFAIFEKGMMGYSKLIAQDAVKNKVLTVIDFGLSSNEKRMWIMDMTTNKVLLNTYVSHGQNTGDEFATKFSNIVNSLQSSLGFYVTGETYHGKNGLSLFIDGQEAEFNSRARERYVVIHGADYANPEFIKNYGRLGRSQGCPAVPRADTEKVINTIKGESVVYIHKNDKDYLEKSTYIN